MDCCNDNVQRPIVQADGCDKNIMRGHGYSEYLMRANRYGFDFNL